MLAQRIGVATADHPAGPWKRYDKPLLDVSTDGFDSGMCVNPTVARGGDGRFLLIYKAREKKRAGGKSGIYLYTAFSDSPTGPFERTQKRIIAHPTSRFALRTMGFG